MRIIAIGDIHGRGVWETIVKQEQAADIIVFVGDYLDSFDVGIWEQIENMHRIFELAERDSRVRLLIGNHDFHYTRYADERYSGFKPVTFAHVSEFLSDAFRRGFLSTVFREGDFLFSHAGVSNQWMTNCALQSVDDINFYVQHSPAALRFVGHDAYGDSPESSPIWIRPESLKRNRVDGLIHVVGHTALGGIVDQKGIYFIDALEKDWYLTIEDGVIEKVKCQFT